jgi:type I restriction enzyme S subunit
VILPGFKETTTWRTRVLDSAVDLCFQNLRRGNVPVGPFKELAAIKSGGTPKRGTTEYYGGDIPWAKIGDLTAAGKWIEETEETITDQGLNSSSARVFPAGTVLFSMYGSIGKTTITRIPMATNQAILGLEPRGSVTAGFLYYALMHARNALFSGAIGTSQMNINAGMVKGFEVPVPSPDLMSGLVRFLSAVEDGADLSLVGGLPEPIDEQRRIVAKIERLAAKIEEARTLHDAARMSLAALPRSIAHQTFMSPELRPFSVKVADLNEAGNEVEVRRSRLCVDGASCAGSSKCLPAGTVVFPKRGGAIATNKKRILGRSALLDPNLMGVQSKKPEQLRPEFILEWFVSFDLSDMQSGTSVPQINRKDLAPKQIPVPPVQIQESLVRHLHWVRDWTDRTRSLHSATGALLDALLPSILDKAFKGEL